MPNRINALIEPDKAELLRSLSTRLFPHTMAHAYRMQSHGHPFGITRLADFLGRKIADAVFTQNARLIVNVAPRQGKSEVCSFAAPAWMIENFPGNRVIVVSHTAELALDFGRRVRNEFDANKNFTVSLSDDSQAANRWNTPVGGGMKTVGVEGAITGFGADLIIVDDPHKNWAEANSRKKRQALVDWFEGTLMDRLEPGGSVIVVMQRWHRDDLTGHLMRSERGGWTLIRLPALAEAGDPMGRKPGDPVCPERFDAEALHRIRDSRPAVVWDAKYQQNPQADADGRAYGSFTRENIADIELRDDLPLQLAFDFNVNPGVHCIVGQYNPACDQFTARYELYGDRANTPAIMRMFSALLHRIGAWRNGAFRFGHCQIYGDRSMRSQNTVTADTDYEVIARELNALNVPHRFRVPSKNPPVKERMMIANDAMKDAKGVIHYRVHPSCARLIRDYEEVGLDEDGLIDKSDPDLTHPSDADTYRIHAQRTIQPVRMTGGRVLTASDFANR